MDREKLLEIHEDIRDFIRMNIRTPVRRFFESLDNTIKWLPVIWTDRQWDQIYLFIIMRKKLVLMRDFFNSDYAIAEGAKKRAKEMDRCINILDRMIDDFCYGEECYDKLNKKWGKLEMTSTPIEGSKYYKANIFRKYADTPEKREQERKESHECFKIEEQEREKDYDELFNNMRKNVRGWLD